MNKRHQILLALCAGVLMFPTHSHATIALHQDGKTVAVTGNITEADLTKFVEMSTLPNLTGIELNSDGGDVHAAMSIGEIVRQKKLTATVMGMDRCLSSCALIFISAVRRFNFGEIGLHRPYLGGKPRNAKDIEQNAQQMLVDIKAYVRRMGITDDFYSAMVNVDPAQMLVFKNIGEIEKLVPRIDPIYDEVEVNRFARYYGVTREEFRKRRAFSDECTSAEQLFNAANSGRVKEMLRAQETCMNSRLWGLSEPIYFARDASLSTKCRLSDAERKVLQATLPTERQDHPLTIASETCVRNIMLDK